MADKETLYVLQRKSNSSKDDESSYFIVDEELRELSESDMDAIFRTLTEAKDNFETTVPVYETYWPRLTYPAAPVPTPSTALTHLIPIYLRLENRVEEDNAERIVCGENLQENFRAIVYDVAREQNLAVEGGHESERLRGYLIGTFGLFLIMVDQLFSMVLTLVEDIPDTTDTVFITNINRFDSIEPILEAAEYSYETLTPRPAIAWLWIRLRGTAPESSITITPVHYFANLQTILETLRLAVVDLPRELFVRQEFEREMTRFLRAEFDVRMEKTVAYTFAQIVRNSKALAHGPVMDEVCGEVDCSNVVISSLGDIQLAMLNTSRRRDVNTYYVPHSVVTGYCFVLPEDTIYFVSGPVDRAHLEQSSQVGNISNIRALGRPYLSALHNRYKAGEISATKEEYQDSDTYISIVIATQPFQWCIREELVRTVLNGIEEIGIQAGVTIKIHPNEDIEEYATFAEKRDVTVSEADLYGHIRSADVVLTINSNVGIESMVLETPCVCFNLWSPLVRTRPYALHGPVPVVTSTEEWVTLLEELDGTEVNRLVTQQSRYVRDGYLVTEDTASAIATHIQGTHEPQEIL